MSSVLVVDDDTALCRSIEIQMKAEGHGVRTAGTGAEGLAALESWRPDLVLLDLKLPDREGTDVLREIASRPGSPPVVMITGQQDTEAAIEAMRSGAFDYVRKPFDLDDIRLLLEKVRQREEPAPAKVEVGTISDRPYELVGADRRIVEVVKQIGLLSRSRVTVLIEGETGTGKELAARILHQATSPGEPFVAVNCSAVVSTLSESELFGHEKGAFTGADRRKTGKLEHAGSGTVFFDEIGDMPLELQSKLLRVLQERVFERVGGLESIRFEARVVAGTNRNLARLVEAGKFRQDLYYRLAVSRLVLPPLRERREDIPLLVEHLLDRIGQRLHRRIDAIEEEALNRLVRYNWPGNVRELENVLTRSVALARDPVVKAADIETSLGTPEAARPEADRVVPLREAEREHVKKALSLYNWNITRTAHALEISPTTLRKKIQDYGLESPD